MKFTAKSTNRNLIIVTILAATLALVAFTGGWYYILKISADGNKLATEADNYLLENSALSNLLLSLAKIDDQKDVIYESIPKAKDVSSFLASFEGLVAADGLKITSTKVGSIKTTSKASNDLSQTISKNEYYELPVNYEIKGNYMNLSKLLADMEVQDRLTSVSNLAVVADGGKDVAPGNVRATLTVTIYIKR